MSGGTNQTDKGVADLLAEVIKAINKDSVPQLAPSRVVQGTPAIGALCAYDALDTLADRIAVKVAEQIVDTSVQPTGRPTIVVLQAGEEVPDLLEYRSLVVRLETIGAQLRAATKEGKEALEKTADATLGWYLADDKVAALIDPGTVALVGAAAQAAMALIGTFTRTVTTEQHGNVAIADTDLLAAMAKALQNSGIEALRPATLALKAAEWAGREGRLIARLEDLDKEAKALRRVMGGIETLLAPKPAGAASAAATPAERAGVIARIREISGDAEPEDQPSGPSPTGPTRLPDMAALRAAKLNGEAALGSLQNAWSALPAALPRLIRADAVDHVLASGGLLLGLRLLVASGSAIRKETGIAWWREEDERGVGTVLAAFVLLNAKASELASGRLTATVCRTFELPEHDSESVSD